MNLTRPQLLHRAFISRGFYRDASDTSSFTYEGVLLVEGRSITTRISLKDTEFSSRPTVVLPNRNIELPDISAHFEGLEPNDGFCFISPDEIVLDRYNIEGSIQVVIKKVQEALKDLINCDHIKETFAEFPQHWMGELVLVPHLPHIVEDVEFYKVMRGDLDEKVYVLTNSLNLIPLFRKAVHTPNFTSTHLGKVKLVDSKVPLVFDRGYKAPETWGEMLEWLTVLDSVLRDECLEKILSGDLSNPHIFIRAPNAFIGISLRLPWNIRQAVKRPAFLKKFLEDHPEKIEIRRFAGGLMTGEFMYNRNFGGRKNLSDIKIVLIGCGTIGGYLAKQLTQSGAGFGHKAKLLLVDQQTLQPGNIGRHWLGVPDIGRNKAEAVQANLLFQHPNLKIGYLDINVSSHLDLLKEYDLVIDATGEEALGYSINEYLVQQRKNGNNHTASIFSSIFGNGVAVQALLVDSLNVGCLKCLRPDFTKREFNPLQEGFDIARIQPKDGEPTYIPYGVAASTIAASLALELAIDWRNETPSPRLRTISLSTTLSKYVPAIDILKYKGCPACGRS